MLTKLEVDALVATLGGVLTTELDSGSDTPGVGVRSETTGVRGRQAVTGDYNLHRVPSGRMCGLVIHLIHMQIGMLEYDSFSVFRL